MLEVLRIVCFCNVREHLVSTIFFAYTNVREHLVSTVGMTLGGGFFRECELENVELGLLLVHPLLCFLHLLYRMLPSISIHL